MLEQLKKTKVSLYLTTVLFLALSQFDTTLGYNTAKAQQSCRSLLSQNKNKIADTPVEYGKLKPSFQHNTNYTVEIRHETKIKNQCSLGTCHLHAWASYLESDYADRTNQEIKISTKYLSANHWLNTSLDNLSAPVINTNIELGLDPDDSKVAINQYGIIPDEAWKPKTEFDEFSSAPKITEYINNITARVKIAVEAENNSEVKFKIIENGKNKIREIFKNTLGELPTSFEYNKKLYTPESFKNEFFPELNNKVIMIAPGKKKKEAFELQNVDGNIIGNLNMDTFEKTLMENLDKGQSLFATYEHNNQFVDPKTGIMSINAFQIPQGAGPVSRKLRQSLSLTSGEHAIQIVGYDLDPTTKKIIKWKIKNSWGTNVGDHGYFHMYEDYFRAFISGAVFIVK